MDGINGLAGTMALVPLRAFAWVAYPAHPFAARFSLAAIGAVLGCLIFNLPARFNHRMRVFMGDAGSTVLGSLVGGARLAADSRHRDAGDFAMACAGARE